MPLFSPINYCKKAQLRAEGIDLSWATPKQNTLLRKVFCSHGGPTSPEQSSVLNRELLRFYEIKSGILSSSQGGKNSLLCSSRRNLAGGAVRGQKDLSFLFASGNRISVHFSGIFYQTDTDLRPLPGIITFCEIKSGLLFFHKRGEEFSILPACPPEGFKQEAPFVFRKTCYRNHPAVLSSGLNLPHLGSS